MFNVDLEKGIMGMLEQLANEEVLYQIDVALAPDATCTHSLLLTSKYLFLKPKQLHGPNQKITQTIMYTGLCF